LLSGVSEGGQPTGGDDSSCDGGEALAGGERMICKGRSAFKYYQKATRLIGRSGPPFCLLRLIFNFFVFRIRSIYFAPTKFGGRRAESGTGGLNVQKVVLEVCESVCVE